MVPVSLYQRGGHEESELIRAHMPMVNRVAAHLRGRIPPFMELEELIQVGMVGLIEAARAFDPSRGVDFELFALRRIRGSMLDEVRRHSFLPRSAVAFKRSESEALRVLEGQLGRSPSEMELALHMGESLPELQRRREAAFRSSTSMDGVDEEVLNIPIDPTQQPDALAEQSQAIERLMHAVDGLDERYRLVMSLYYVDELNLKEIGATIGVSESRVSQILTAIVKKLRQELGFAN